MRDEFTYKTKETLARRVAMRCSNPKCQKTTSGPCYVPDKSINIGVAAHITAASPSGPRYDPALSAIERRSISNGIWLCQNCAKLIDNDPAHFTVTILRAWKNTAENQTRSAVQSTSSGCTERVSISRQSSKIMLYNRTLELNRIGNGKQATDDTLREVGRQIHLLIAYAHLESCDVNHYNEFNYIFSLILTPQKDSNINPSLDITLACHITPFVAIFQELFDLLLDGTDADFMARTSDYASDLTIRLSYKWAEFIPYRISRVGPKQVSIKAVDDTRPIVRFPLSTSDLLVLLAAMHAGKVIVYDPMTFSDNEQAFIAYTENAKNRGNFSLSDFSVDVNNPESWTMVASGFKGQTNAI